MGKYLSFKEARKKVRNNNLKSRRQFREFLKKNNIDNIPVNPGIVYDEWISIYDWLGIEKKSNKNTKKLDYKSAVKLVHQLIIGSNIKTKNDWLKFYENNLNSLILIPKYPNIKYKEAGWESWSKWLNTKSRSDKYDFTIEDIREIINTYNIQTREEYYSLCKSKMLPTNPISKFGLNKWGDILCKKTKKKKFEYLEFNDAKKVVSNLKLKSQREWYKLSKENKIPNGVPKTPNKYYEEWVSWNDWLNHEITTHKNFISYKRAKKYLKDKGINSLQEYYDFVVSNQIDFLPLSPSTYYGSEYKSINDFLSDYNINISYGERKIIKLLEEKNINFIHQYKFEDCKNKSYLIFDFYLPDHNICIEFDGKQHFEPIEFFGGVDSFISLIERDSIKNNYCYNNNIFLVRISYEDINIIEKIINKVLF